MLVEIAEAGPLPATKCMVGERHGNSEVYAHHPHLHTVHEVAGSVAVARKDRDPISIFVFRRQTHRFFIVLRPYHREDRPEDFLLVDAHVRLDLVEQATPHEISVLVPLQFEAATIDHKLGAFLHAQVDIILHLIQMRPRDQRSIIGLRVVRRTNFQAFDSRNQFFDKNVSCFFADGNCDRNRHAALAGGAIACTDQSIDGLVDIGIGHHNHMVLRTAEALNAFAVGASGRIDVLGDRRRADEADRHYARVG
jgi:hypothetical protein